MPPLTVAERIEAPRDRVFALLADIPGAAGRIRAIEGIEVLSPAPDAPDNLGVVGRGFQWRETRTMFGKRATEDMTITQWSPPQRYTAEARSHGCHYKSTIAADPEGDTATRVTMTFEAIPQTFAAKAMMKVFAFMNKKIEQALRTDLQDLKNIAESP